VLICCFAEPGQGSPGLWAADYPPITVDQGLATGWRACLDPWGGRLTAVRQNDNRTKRVRACVCVCVCVRVCVCVCVCVFWLKPRAVRAHAPARAHVCLVCLEVRFNPLSAMTLKNTAPADAEFA
jgi:hypothetical protein